MVLWLCAACLLDQRKQRTAAAAAQRPVVSEMYAKQMHS